MPRTRKPKDLADAVMILLDLSPQGVTIYAHHSINGSRLSSQHLSEGYSVHVYREDESLDCNAYDLATLIARFKSDVLPKLTAKKPPKPKRRINGHAGHLPSEPLRLEFDPTVEGR